jgi:general secretion pathway protein D
LQAPNSTSTATTTTSTTTTGTTSTGTSPTLYDLAHLKASDFQVTIGSATANLLLTDSDTKILQSPRIRATDAQKATMKIGEKIPIATGSYSAPGVTASSAIGYAQTQFQYQDVGVNIEMTPTVHFDHDVTLKIKIDISSEAGQQTIEGVTEPIIAQNVVDQVIRLREGEASILGGLKQTQETVSWNGIPGLSSIPLLKYLFGSKDHTIDDSDLVFLVVPHIVRTQSLDRANLRTIDTGAGASVELRRVPMAAPAPAPAAAQPRSSIGVVPGQSSVTAAPAALAQVDAAADANGQTVSAPVPNPGLPPTTPVAPNTVFAPPPPGTPAPGQPGRPAPAVTGSVNVMFSPPGGPVTAGSTFQVPIVLAGGKDVASVPLQVQYDPAKLSLVNVTQGDLLGRDNQAVALIHRDDGPGSVTINASRPPGTPGISGAGVVCVMSFQAKTAGDTVLTLVRGSAINTAQQPVPAPAARAMINIH